MKLMIDVRKGVRDHSAKACCENQIFPDAMCFEIGVFDQELQSS